MSSEMCIHELQPEQCSTCSGLDDLLPIERRWRQSFTGWGPSYRSGTRRGPTTTAEYPGRCPTCHGGLAVGLFLGFDLKLGRGVCYRCYSRLP